MRSDGDSGEQESDDGWNAQSLRDDDDRDRDGDEDDEVAEDGDFMHAQKLLYGSRAAGGCVLGAACW